MRKMNLKVKWVKWKSPEWWVLQASTILVAKVTECINGFGDGKTGYSGTFFGAFGGHSGETKMCITPEDAMKEVNKRLGLSTT